MDHNCETPQKKSKTVIGDQVSGLPPSNGVNSVTGLPAIAGTGVPDPSFSLWLDKISLEALVEIKISRFFDQLDSHYPEELYTLIIEKVEKTLLHQILRRTGYNQAQASKILGINRNTLRKKMKQFGLA